MALRRPTLLICIVTLVLGINFDFDRRSFGRLQNEMHFGDQPSLMFPPQDSQECKLFPCCPCSSCNGSLEKIHYNESITCCKSDLRGQRRDAVCSRLKYASPVSAMIADSAALYTCQMIQPNDAAAQNGKFQRKFYKMHLVSDAAVIGQTDDMAGKQHYCTFPGLLLTTTEEPIHVSSKENLNCCVVCLDKNDSSTDDSDDIGIKHELFKHYYAVNRDQGSWSEFEHQLSVFSMCFMMVLARSGKLTERVLVSLVNMSEHNAILKSFLDILVGGSNLPQDDSLERCQKPSSGSQLSKPVHHVEQHERKDKPSSNRRTSSNHTAEMAGDKEEKEHISGDKEGKEHPSFSRIFCRAVYRVFPATFLPSAGLSPTDMMSHLGSRLASLYALPTSCSISRVRLAQAGFYYDTSKTERNASNAHELTCYKCGFTYGQWKAGDNPAVIHFNLRPDCDLAKAEAENVVNVTQPGAALPPSADRPPDSLQSVDSGISSMASSTYSGSRSGAFSASSRSFSDNGSLAGSLNSGIEADSGLGGNSFSSSTTRAPGIGAGRSSDLTYSDSTSARRTDGLGDLETDASAILPQRRPEPVTAPSSSAATSLTRPSTNSQYPPRHAPTLPSRAQDANEHPPLVLSSAVYPQFSTQQNRLKTFSTWPRDHAFRPEDLVMQGLYYAGYEDCVRCFYCGVGLKSWAAEDDVLSEHIRYRPSCGFLLNIKGRQFVNSVLQRIGALEPPASAPNPASAAPLTSATTAASHPGTASHAGNVSLTEVESMGFSKDLITKALSLLQQNSPGRKVTVDALVDKILELDSNSSQAPANNPEPEDQLDQDGLAEEGAEGGDSEYSNALRENQRLRSRNICKMCGKAKVALIFMPCGHVNTCVSCGNKTKRCTTCNQHIKATANVFMS